MKRRVVGQSKIVDIYWVSSQLRRVAYMATFLQFVKLRFVRQAKVVVIYWFSSLLRRVLHGVAYRMGDCSWNTGLVAPLMTVSRCLPRVAGTSEWLSTHSCAVLIRVYHGDQSAHVQATFAIVES